MEATRSGFGFFCCVSIMLIGLAFISNGDARVDAGSTVGVWLFEEGEGDTATDYSGKGLDGAIEGKAEWVEGVFGKAMEFDGEVRIVVPSLGEVKGDEGSVVLWVNPDFELLDGGYYGLISIGGYYGDGAGAKDEKCHEIFKEKRDAWFFRVGHDDPNVGAGTNQFITNKDLAPKGEWTHIAMTWEEGGESPVYVNGSKIGAVSANTKTPTSWRQEKIFIGTSWDNKKHKGLIDEVGIFNRAVSAVDIKNIMDNGLDRSLSLTAVFAAGKLSSTWADIKVRRSSP